MKRTPFLFSAGTPMAARLAAFAWERTSLGPPERWDSALKTLVPVMLASSQPMFVAWGPTRTLLYNDAYAEILADKHPAALGCDVLDVWHEIRESLLPIVCAAYRGEPVQMNDIELWMERRGYREETHFSFFYSPLRAESGEVAGLFCACNEITGQILTERKLAESEARHRGVLEHMDEGFTLFDRDFTILEVNGPATRLVGLTREELIGHNHWERFPESFDSPVGHLYRQALAEQKPQLLEHLYRFADGRERWFEVRAFPVGDKLAVLFRDVTEPRKLRQDVADSLERMQLALDAGAILGTWVWNIRENLVLADARFAEAFGLDPLQLKSGAPIERAFAAIHADDRPRVQDAVARAVQERGRYRCQYRVLREGRYRWVEANGRVEVDAQGVPTRFPGVLLDVEERRRVEAERDRVTAMLETFIEAVPGVVFAKDREGRYLIANRGLAETLGLARERIVGRSDADILPDPSQAAALRARDEAVMDSGQAQQAEEWVTRADGTASIWWSTKEPLRDATGAVVGLVGTSVDISERKAMEDVLRLSKQRAALAMEVAQLGTWHFDVATGSVTADARCREMCGLDPDLPSFQLAELRQRVHPEDWPGIERALQRALDPEGAGQYAEEFRWVHADGRVVWTASRGIARFESDGRGRRAASLLGSVIDITQRRQLIEALREADRRKDEFLAMLAHELRNPLAPIKTAFHVLKLSAEDPQRVRDASSVIGRQVDHLTKLVDDLLDVSRVTRGLVQLEREAVDLQAVVATAVEQVKPLVEERRHELRTHLAPGRFTVRGDFHRLVQIVANLLTNAAKYTPPGGRIALHLARDGERAAVRITDNGVGIAPDMIDKVFELFTQAERTPDRSQGGLGIGLALVRSLVQLHDGHVSASSAGLQQGSTFVVELPLSQETRDLPPGTDRAPGPAGRMRVMIVDDNVDAAVSLGELLQLLGHTVVTAHDGTTAMDRATGEGPWDSFILDIGLPDMTGYELARRLRQTPAGRHSLFLALTGYGQAQDQLISRSSGFDHHLVKPADVSRLLDLLSQHGLQQERAG